MSKVPTRKLPRTFPNPLWVDIVKGAACALDPNPAPVCKRWHSSAVEAFDANFRVLIYTREAAQRRVTPHGIVGHRMVPVGKARKTEAA